MILVKTAVKPSDIGGFGLFAAEDISIGTLVWKFDPMLDIILQRAEVLALPENAREHLRKHSLTNNDGNYQISLDNNQYTNHSYEANITWCEKYNEFIANRHIDAGEEITKDYTTFSHSVFAKSLINKSI